MKMQTSLNLMKIFMVIFIAKNGLNYKNELDIMETDIRNIDINEKENQNSLLLGIN